MKSLVQIVIVVIIIMAAGSAWADGILIPEPLPDLPRPQPFGVKYHHVDVLIEEAVAKTTIDQVFTNPNSGDLEATYIFPVPEAAALSDFAMWIDGERQEAELKDADEARQIYEDIVRRMIDPGLLEYVGRNAFKARVYPVPGNGEKRIALGYSEVLSRQQEMYEYIYPLNTEKFSSTLLDEVLIRVTIKSKTPIRSVYSPSHEIDITGLGSHQVTVTYEANDVRPDADFKLYYTLDTDEVSATVLSHRMPGEDGYFIMLLSAAGSAEREVMNKDVVFVIDTSGSMVGSKIEQARAALRYALEQLNPGDRFGIVDFSSTVRVMDEELTTLDEGRAARREQLDAALAYVDEIRARGGTNIEGALQRALAYFAADAGIARARTVVFLTDGLPTVGETDPGVILQTISRGSDLPVRIFPFGVGYDVNTDLLDNLADDHRGASAYVKPGEDIELAVSNFADQFAEPVMVGLAAVLEGAGVYDLEPERLPDLYRGNQLVLTGRYRTPGNFTLVLQGAAAEDAETALEFPVELTAERQDNDFVARLWAIRRVGNLLLQVRKWGESAELKEEIVGLAKEFGLVTPYTSYLVLEPGMRPELEFDDVSGRLAPAAAPTVAARDMSAGAGFNGYTGSDAVNASININEMKESSVAMPDSLRGNAVRNVGRRNFIFNRDGVWEEEGVMADSSDTAIVDVTLGSDEYFALAAASRENARILALGYEVVFRYNDVCYRVRR